MMLSDNDVDFSHNCITSLTIINTIKKYSKHLYFKIE